MEEIKDDTNKWKDTPCSWIRRVNTVKITVLPEQIYRSNTISIKPSMAFFTELEQKFYNLYGNRKAPKWRKQSWERKTEMEESGSLTSGYTTKLQLSKQNDTGTKTEI